MTRNFEEWLGGFRRSISSYDYYVDFEKVYENAEKIKVELNILNSLVGSQDIETEFAELASKYPEILKCIPILLAVRDKEILAMDAEGDYIYEFKNLNNTVEEYSTLMRETGLFELISTRLINNLVDYVLGVEVGLDSNGRKNRGGHLMENLVEEFIKKAGVTDYRKEMYLADIEREWGLDLSALSNQGQARKRFDFVVKSGDTVYAIETNFYASSGSKLNETARSYKMLALESKAVEGFEFVWLTDGMGWLNARGNLKETFQVSDHIYSIVELENDALSDLFGGDDSFEQ